jgi:hypothetical protein
LKFLMWILKPFACCCCCNPSAAAAAAARGRTCSFAQDQWGMCDSSQIANNMNVARSLGGGGAMNLSPCDILPYLRGRTLWILG